MQKAATSESFACKRQLSESTVLHRKDSCSIISSALSWEISVSLLMEPWQMNFKLNAKALHIFSVEMNSYPTHYMYPTVNGLSTSFESPGGLQRPSYTVLVAPF